jgi:hypothetical protein
MRRFFAILTTFIMSMLLLGFTFATLRQTRRRQTSGNFVENAHVTASPSQSQNFLRRANPERQPGQEAAYPQMSASRRISIPFGFDGSLALGDAGQSIQVIGHGGCTQGEQVAVAVTITQSTTGAVATADLQQDCTGDLQHWQVMATTKTITPFVADTAEACGLATSRADGSVTDTFEWCVGVELNWQNYLPLVLNGLE